MCLIKNFAHNTLFKRTHNGRVGRAYASRSKGRGFESPLGQNLMHSNFYGVFLMTWLTKTKTYHTHGVWYDRMHIPFWLRVIKALNQEPTLGLHSGAAPSVEALHHVNDPDTGRNSGGRRLVTHAHSNKNRFGSSIEQVQTCWNVCLPLL